MALDQVKIALPVGGWTLLTDANATTISFQILGGVAEIRYVSGTGTPAETVSGFAYGPTQGEQAKALSVLTTLPSANRVWARAMQPNVSVLVEFV